MRCAKFSPWDRPVVVVAVLAAALLSLPTTVQADSVSSPQVLPADVYMYFSVPNVEELKNRWNKTKFSEIQNDPAFEEFRGQIEEQLEKVSREFEQNTGLKVKELLDLPSGEVALALMKPPREQLAGVAFLDFGNSEDLVDQLLAKLEDTMKDQNADRKVQEFENTRIVVYTLPEAEQAEGPFKPGFSYFVKGTQLVVSSHVAALESILSRWDGGEDLATFAEDRTFKHIMETCKIDDREPVFQWFINPIEALKAAVMAGAEGNPQAAMALGFLPVLGLNDFQGMGGAMDWATEGYESVSKTMLYVRQPPQGLLNLFHFPAADLAPPKWVTEDAQAYVGANWDVDGAYEAVETLVDTFQGAGALDRIVDDLADRPAGPGVHIKKDILDQLTGRFYMMNQGVEDFEQQVPKMIVSLGLRDAKKMQDFIAKMIRMDGVPAETRDFRGETIVEFDAGNEQAKAALSVYNDALMITSDVQLLEQVIRGDRAEKPLAESAAYRQISQEFPEKTSMVSFQQADEQLRTLYESARKGELDELGDQEVPLDFSKLPPFEALQKYLPISGGYTIPDENGVLFISLSQMEE